MRIGSYRITADWDHVGVATGLMAFCAWYFFDARAVSNRLDNLLLIAPMSLAAVVLYAVILSQEIKLGRVQTADTEPSTFQLDWLRNNWRIPVFMALLGIYVFTMRILGFDLATFLFMLLSLVLQGERRWPMLVGYSLIFAVVVTWFFKTMLTVSVPTLFW